MCGILLVDIGMRYEMINKQFSKCPVCGSDEKYAAWVVEGNETKKVKCCSKQCMLDDTKRKKGKK